MAKTTRSPSADGSRSVSLYLSERTIGILDSRSRSRSDALRAVAERYDALMRSSLPELPPTVWHAVFDTFAGSSNSGSSQSPREDLVTSIGDGLMGEFDEESEIDPGIAAILRSLGELTDCEAAAVLDLNDRYWSGADKEARALAAKLMGMA